MKIIGAKAVLRYLLDRGVPMCRDTLHRLSRRDANRFPLDHRMKAFRVQVTADSEKIDRWLARNEDRQTKQTASGHGADLPDML